jgi:RNA recognition motif-containing protein
MEDKDIVRVDILTAPPRGRSKGCAILQFSSPERAQYAIHICHNTELKGRLLWAREDRETSELGSAAAVLDADDRNHIHTNSASSTSTSSLRISHHNISSASTGAGNGAAGIGTTTTTNSATNSNSTTTTTQGRRVYVGNLSWDVAWQDLKDHMRQVGDVLFAEVMTDGNTGRSKGCGIVEFHTSQDAQRAIRTLNDTELKGRLIFVREDRERPPQSQSQQHTPHSTTATTTISNVDSPTSSLLISNIPWNTTWYQLKDFISTTIAAAAAAAIDPVTPEHVQIIASAKGGRAPYAIVRYATIQDAQYAREILQGVIFMGKPLDVQFDHHQPLRRGK